MSIIAMWSGPRNLSTAMMRSFGSRADCSVMDEPFFAPYLKVTGKAHPGREETLERHERDSKKVAAICAASPKTTYSFQKHMPHHMLEGFPMGWTKEAKHFFLIREPVCVIASYAKGREIFEIEDLGYARQRRLWEDLGCPPVIDSTDILRAPEVMLKRLCAAIDIPWDEAMLSWDAGGRPEDGAWGPYWYKSVENSTGFSPLHESLPQLNEEHFPILEAVQADFDKLYEARVH